MHKKNEEQQTEFDFDGMLPEDDMEPVGEPEDFVETEAESDDEEPEEEDSDEDRAENEEKGEYVTYDEPMPLDEEQGSYIETVLVKAFKKKHGLRIHLYQYVPPCPRCKSRRTGRYTKMPALLKDREYKERESLKNGEIIRFCAKLPYKNLFCVNCDNTWHGLVEQKMLSRSEIQQEVDARETYEAYMAVLEEQMEKEEKKKGFFRKYFI